MHQNASVQLAFKLVDLFYPLVEVALFDSKREIVEIRNPFSSLKEDQELKNFTEKTPFQEFLTIGRTVRCLIQSLKEGVLRIRFDLTHFKNFQEQLMLLVSADQQGQGLLDQWKESIDHIMTEFLKKNKINLQAASMKQKRELISQIQKQGLFDFKESSAYVASKLQISRATVYNYLKTAAHLRKVHIHQVDAFTNKRFGGNPAGVVLDAGDLDELTMKKITRELNLSETAFVSPSKKGNFRMRYFTPTGHEIAFCGHSTVGSLYMIAKEKQFGVGERGTFPFKVETPCGILNMEVSIDETGEIAVAYETPKIKLKASNLTHAEVAKAASFDERFIDSSIPVMVEETNKDLFVTIRSLEALRQIECDPKSFSHFSKQHDLVALCLLTSETFDARNQFHMRCFAPHVGIPEDPFTGSVLGGLAAYVDKFKLLPKEQVQFRVEQGHFIDRPGTVEVVYLNKQQMVAVKVVAQATHCFSTEINLT